MNTPHFKRFEKFFCELGQAIAKRTERFESNNPSVDEYQTVIDAFKLRLRFVVDGNEVQVNYIKMNDVDDQSEANGKAN